MMGGVTEKFEGRRLARGHALQRIFQKYERVVGFEEEK